MKRHRVPFGAESVGAIEYPAPGARALLLLAHGAGANHEHPFLVELAGAFAQSGVAVVTFNFLYMERGRRLPDPGNVLENCYQAAIEFVRAQILDGRLLVVGGKSMGGRIASQLCARTEQGERGLIFFGYPLHPPDKPNQLRSKHLPNVRSPMLFVQGTRDEFGTPEEISAVTRGLPNARLFPVEGGDHSYKVLKKNSLPQAEVIPTIVRAAGEWLVALS